MKIFVVVLFLANALVQAENESDPPFNKLKELEPEEEECIVELKLDIDEIKTINQNEILPEDNEKFNEFIECAWKKKNYQLDNGDIDYDKLSESIRDFLNSELNITNPFLKRLVLEVNSNAILYCKNHPPPRGNNNGQTAIRTQNCFIGKLRELLNKISS